MQFPTHYVHIEFQRNNGPYEIKSYSEITKEGKELEFFQLLKNGTLVKELRIDSDEDRSAMTYEHFYPEIAADLQKNYPDHFDRKIYLTSWIAFSRTVAVQDLLAVSKLVLKAQEHLFEIGEISQEELQSKRNFIHDAQAKLSALREDKTFTVDCSLEKLFTADIQTELPIPFQETQGPFKLVSRRALDFNTPAIEVFTHDVYLPNQLLQSFDVPTVQARNILGQKIPSASHKSPAHQLIADQLEKNYPAFLNRPKYLKTDIDITRNATVHELKQKLSMEKAHILHKMEGMRSYAKTSAKTTISNGVYDSLRQGLYIISRRMGEIPTERLQLKKPSIFNIIARLEYAYDLRRLNKEEARLTQDLTARTAGLKAIENDPRLVDVAMDALKKDIAYCNCEDYLKNIATLSRHLSSLDSSIKLSMQFPLSGLICSDKTDQLITAIAQKKQELALKITPHLERHSHDVDKSLKKFARHPPAPDNKLQKQRRMGMDR